MYNEPAESIRPAMGLARKRELSEISQRPVKRSKPAEGHVVKQFERRFKRRKLQEVLDELCTRVENSERQLFNNILRELDIEHIRVVEKSEIVTSCKKLLRAIVATKADHMNIKLFRALTGILESADHKHIVSVFKLISEQETSKALLSKNCLDCKVLELYSSGLDNQHISREIIPEQVMISARRSLSQVNMNSSQIRFAALWFLVSYAIADIRDEATSSECEETLCKLAKDRDFRARHSAAKGLLRLSDANVRLSKTTYPIVKELLNDTDSRIRIIAINLIIYFANRPPIEKLDPADAITITDDAFSSVCDAMNDIEIAVRVEAARTLGDFEYVTEDLIYQTLDKKMMRSNKAAEVVKVDQSMFAMTKKNQGHNDKRWKFAKKGPKVEQEPATRGGWSRGKELHAACPDNNRKEEEEDEDSIIPHGACGAFVSALEDEFMDVRKAAVYSLGRLASTRPTFAVSALEYLADMFNDEIAEVRLDAINALTPLISHGQLNCEQLNVILKCLDDAMPDSRQAMRELLKRAQFVDIACIQLCVKALLACLKRFPKDQDQIFACMGVIGRTHSVQVQSTMRHLLNLHLHFETKEHSLEDLNYLAKLIMVLNAASQQQSMVYVLPEFVKRHYRFLRSSSPHFVLPIRLLDEQQNGKARMPIGFDSKAEEIVIQTYNRLCETASGKQLPERNMQRECIFTDASAICTYNDNVSGAARLICCLGEVSAAVDNAAHTILCGGEIFNVKHLVEQHIADIQAIEYQFTGLTDDILCYMLQCRLYLSLLEIFVWLLDTIPQQQDIINNVVPIIREYRRMLISIRKVSEPLNELLTTCEQTFVKQTVGDDSKKIITAATVGLMLEKFTPKMPSDFPPIRNILLKYAKITNPNKDTAIETTLKFFANMPHGVPLEAELYNMTEDDMDNLRVKISLPDGTFDLMKPRTNDIRMEGNHFFVSTTAKITSASSWSEAAEIDITLGVVTPKNNFVQLFASPSCFSPAHVRVKIQPIAR